MTEWFENDVISIGFGRKRRGLNTRLRDEYGYLYLSPELQEALIPAEVLASQRKRSTLTPEAVATLRELSRQGATLRAIAAAVGVSHETVRNTLKAS